MVRIKRGRQLFPQSERCAVNDEVQAAELLIDSGKHRLDVGIRCDIARKDERCVRESLRQFLNVLFESALVGESEPAPRPAVACAIAHAMERLLATPTIRPCLPEKSDTLSAAFAPAASTARSLTVASRSAAMMGTRPVARWSLTVPRTAAGVSRTLTGAVSWSAEAGR